MKTARLGSILAIAAMTIAAAGAAWALGGQVQEIDSSALRSVAVGVGTSLIAGAVLLPLAFSMDRGMQQLRRYLNRLGEEEETTAFDGPRWLRPLGTVCSRSIEQWREKAASAESRLREAQIRQRISEADQEHTEAILHSLRDAVLVSDPFNELVMANEAAGRLLGFDPAEAAHQPVDRILNDATLLGVIKDTCDAGNVAGRRHIEHTIGSDPEGATQTFDVVASCLPGNTQGSISGVVTILHDISREREISQLKTDFVSKASHELRTPLSSIRAYVEMLLDGEATDEGSRREFYEIIQNEANRLGRLIDNMLNISRMEAGIVQVERTEVDFETLTDEVVEVMKPQAEAKDISLSYKIGPERFTAEADRDMMYQVLLNLLSNGVKYTPEGGRVTVILENDEAARSVLVTVADTGLGIPPDSMDKLFQKFYRIENYKRVAKGTGLGLNLVKHIVETVHCGQIGVSSQLGMGSRFWFSIPYTYMGAESSDRPKQQGESHVAADADRVGR